MANHIIFIDFSSSSTAICKFDVKKKKYTYYLLMNHYTFTASDTRDPFESETLKKFKGVGSDLIMSVYKRKPMSRPKGSPSAFCRHMLQSCYNISTTFDNLLDLVLANVDLDKTIFGIEDYAVGIKSNNNAEMVELISSCKNKLFGRGIELASMHFYQPQTIKSITGNGNAKKIDMLNFFVKRCVQNNVNKVIGSNMKFWEMSKGQVKKPVEDIVDAFCGVQLMRKEFNL